MKFVKGVVIAALVLAILMGVTIGSVECYRLARGAHDFNYRPFIATAVMIFFPAFALQLMVGIRGNIGDAFKFVVDELPKIKLGRRDTDAVAAVVAPAPAKPPVPIIPAGPIAPKTAAEAEEEEGG